GPLQRRTHRLVPAFPHQRTHQGRFLVGVPDPTPQLPVGVHDLFRHLVDDVLVHDQATQRGTPLPGSTGRRKYTAPHHQIQIRRRGDHSRVVTTQLQQITPHPAGNLRGDRPPHVGRPG